jgi:hypothetical protein
LKLKSPRRLRLRAAPICWIVFGSWGVLSAGGCSDEASPALQREAGAGSSAEKNPGAAGSGGTETGTDGGSDGGDAGSTTGGTGGEGATPSAAGGEADLAGAGGAAASGGAGPDLPPELQPAEGWQPFSGGRVNAGDSDAHDPQLAFDASGNGHAFAVWPGFYAGGDSIYVSHFVEDWSEPRGLTSGGVVGTDPQIAADGHGNAVAIWRQLQSQHFGIYTSRYSVTTSSWSSPEPQAVQSDFDAHAPAISADFDGDMVAVWKQDYGQNGVVGGSHVFASVLAVAGDVASWGPPLPLSGDQPAQCGSPRIALTSAGGGFAVWAQDYQGNRAIFAAKYTKGLGFEPAQKLGFSDFVGEDPDVAVTAAGNAVAAWRQRGADGSWGIAINNFASIANNWAPANLQLSANTSEVGAPRIASNAEGAYAVAWWQSKGGWRSLYASRGQLKSNGEGSGASGTAIESDDRGDAQQPSVAVGKDGTALVAWSQFLGATDNVVLARNSGSGWKLGTVQALPGRQAATPVVRVRPGSNDAMALWQELVGSAPAAKNIFGAAFTTN